MSASIAAIVDAQYAPHSAPLVTWNQTRHRNGITGRNIMRASAREVVWMQRDEDDRRDPALPGEGRRSQRPVLHQPARVRVERTATPRAPPFAERAFGAGSLGGGP